MYKYILLLLTLALFTSCQPKEKWIPLFNGKDLSGWKPKIAGYEFNDNFANTFRVEDGVLKISYDQYPDSFQGEFGHIFYEKAYSHYRLRLEYRFVGEQLPGGPGWAFRNNGIMFHCQSPESMNLNQDFPVSLEFQLLGGNGTDPRTTGNLCTPGTNVILKDSLFTPHCTSSDSPTYHGDQWVKAEVLVLGDSLIQHIIEDKVVLTYSRPQIGGGHLPDNFPAPAGARVTQGFISLQSETHPTEFRNIELMDLSARFK